MNKSINDNVGLKTIMQEADNLATGQCYNGVLTRVSENSYLFEEAVHIDRHGKRNPKIYEGNFVSLVHMQNGKYQVHMRTIGADAAIDLKELAFKVYSELLNAFNIID